MKTTTKALLFSVVILFAVYMLCFQNKPSISNCEVYDLTPTAKTGFVILSDSSATQGVNNNG